MTSLSREAQGSHQTVAGWGRSSTCSGQAQAQVGARAGTGYSAAMSSRQLKFPANIYAAALELEYGRAEYTGYGLAGKSIDGSPVDIAQAQHKVAGLLLARLPVAPARILEVGCGLGTLALKLAQTGHAVTAISDEPEEINLLQTVTCANLQCHHTRFQTFSSTLKFDVIIFHNSAHYIKPLNLLSKAQKLLSDGGQLLISDEFVLDNSRIEPGAIPVLKDFLQLAERLFFRAAEQIIFNEEVAICVNAFLPLLENHQQALTNLTGIPVAQLEDLHAALLASSEKFINGCHAYALLDLRSSSVVDDKEEVFGSIDSFVPTEIQQMFERSFNTRFDEQIWAWKYGNGRGRAVCIRQHGNIVAHYGGAPRDILYFGKAHKAIQICDVMVLPEKRSFFSKEGLFFRSAATFLEQEVGNAAEHLLGFGFPNIKAMHIAERLGLYEKTDELVEVLYPAVDLSSPAAHADQQLSAEIFDPRNAAAQLKVDQLWGNMQSEYLDAVIGLRDWDYLSYRYFNHPHARYYYYQVLDAQRQLIGLLVLREHGGSFLLMDVIAAPADMPAVIESCHRLLVEQAETDVGLRSWITRAHASKIMTAGATVHELQIEIPCNRWSRGPATETLTGSWWLTAGDMDFM